MREPRQPSPALSPALTERDRKIAQLEARNAELAEELANARSTGEEPDEDDPELDEDGPEGDPLAGWTLGELVYEGCWYLASAHEVDRWPPMPSRDQEEMKKLVKTLWVVLARLSDKIEHHEAQAEKKRAAAERAAKGGDK